EDELESDAARVRGELERRRLWVHPDALDVRLTPGIPRREADLEVGRVLMIGRGEGALGGAREALDEVGVAGVRVIGSTVVQDDVPGESRGGEGCVFGIGGGARVGDRIYDFLLRPRHRSCDGRIGSS